MQPNNQPAGGGISFHFPNIDAKDALFIAAVIRLFTAAENIGLARGIRSGAFVIEFNSETGGARVIENHVAPRVTCAQVMEFTARFTNAEWTQITTCHRGIVDLAQQDIAQAEALAREALGGQLPPPVKFAITTG